MLKINSLTKFFGDTSALSEINLQMPLGKTHILLGSSGSGKSTLLRAILGLISWQSGTIELNGETMNTFTPAQRSERIGYVPQGGGLFPHLTVRDNVTIVARAQGWSENRINERMEELLSSLAVDRTLLERFPNEISGGQKQRVSILRATFLNPPLLLMDEPLGALDPLIRAALQAELKDIFLKLKKTVILVTHDIEEAAYLGDQIILMHQGKVVQSGTFADLNERPADPFVRRFLQAQRAQGIEIKS